MAAPAKGAKNCSGAGEEADDEEDAGHGETLLVEERVARSIRSLHITTNESQNPSPGDANRAVGKAIVTESAAMLKTLRRKSPLGVIRPDVKS